MHHGPARPARPEAAPETTHGGAARAHPGEANVFIRGSQGDTGARHLEAWPGGDILGTTCLSGREAWPGGDILGTWPGGDILEAWPGGEILEAWPGGDILEAWPGGDILGTWPGGDILGTTCLSGREAAGSPSSSSLIFCNNTEISVLNHTCPEF